MLSSGSMKAVSGALQPFWIGGASVGLRRVGTGTGSGQGGEQGKRGRDGRDSQSALTG